MKNIAILAILTTLILAHSSFGQDKKGKKGRDQGRPRQANPEQAFKFMDKNKDGKISLDEAPAMMKNRFQQIDQNKDGFVDGQELKQAFGMRGQRGGKAGPGRPPGNAAPGKPNDKPNAGPGRPGFGKQGLAGPGGMNLEKMFQEGDRDGDGNLNPEEQKAVIARFNQMLNRFRQMRGAGNGIQKQGNRFGRPNTDPVKPKRPGK